MSVDLSGGSHPKNSLDLLRLVAATLVLYSHQHVLTGLAEQSFFGWILSFHNTFPVPVGRGLLPTI